MLDAQDSESLRLRDNNMEGLLTLLSMSAAGRVRTSQLNTDHAVWRAVKPSVSAKSRRRDSVAGALPLASLLLCAHMTVGARQREYLRRCNSCGNSLLYNFPSVEPLTGQTITIFSHLTGQRASCMPFTKLPRSPYTCTI